MHGIISHIQTQAVTKIYPALISSEFKIKKLFSVTLFPFLCREILLNEKYWEIACIKYCNFCSHLWGLFFAFYCAVYNRNSSPRTEWNGSSWLNKLAKLWQTFRLQNWGNFYSQKHCLLNSTLFSLDFLQHSNYVHQIKHIHIAKRVCRCGEANWRQTLKNIGAACIIMRVVETKYGKFLDAHTECWVHSQHVIWSGKNEGKKWNNCRNCNAWNSSLNDILDEEFSRSSFLQPLHSSKMIL